MRARARIEHLPFAVALAIAGCGGVAATSENGTTPSGASAQHVTLRFRPAVGASWRFDTTMLNETQEGRVEAQMDFTQRVTSLDDAGRRVIETHCERIALRQPVQQGIDCTPDTVEAFDASGRSQEPGATAHATGSTQNERPVFLAYPPHEVAVGDTWHDTVRWVQTDAQSEYAIDATFSLTSLTPEGDDLVAHVHMGGGLTMRDARQVPASELGGAEGQVSADFALRVSDGFMESMTLEMRFDILIPAALGGGRSPALTRFTIQNTPVVAP